MHARPIVYSAMAVTLGGLLACSPSTLSQPDSPLNSAPVSATGPSAPATAASATGLVASATGSGHIMIAGERRTFAFNAKKAANGSVTGQFQLNNRQQEVVLHAEITCITVVGNRARIGARITRSTSTATLPGFFSAFTVVDNGEGSSAPPDQLSLVFSSPAPGFDTFHCSTGFFLPLNPVEDGNIQVH